MNCPRLNLGNTSKKALIIALVSAIILQPFAPMVAFADIGGTQNVNFDNPGSAVWTVPSGVTSIKVMVWGAGGAAGSGEKITDAHRSGLGGGAGGYVEKVMAVTPGGQYTVTVGTGGQGIKSVSEGRIGNEGTDSRFEGANASLVAQGGLGGRSFTGHGNPTGDLGQGGQASGGDTNISGGNAAPYIEYDSNPYASNGGSAHNGGQGGNRGRCGRDGTCPGSDPSSPWATDGGFPGGGGGGSDVGSGGNGGNGRIAIEATVPVDHSPVGFLDSVACDAILGWAYDSDSPTTALAVHFYVDGPAGAGTFIGDTTANLVRADVNANAGIQGDHGFSFATPASIKNNAARPIYAYGINSDGSTSLNNSLLTNSPMSLSCAPAGTNPPHTGVNLAPSEPTVTTSGTAINAPVNFTAVSTDPEGNAITYGFDWDDNGTYDEFTGQVSSGTQGQLAHTWSTAGTYTVGVGARDSHNAFSPRKAVTVTVSAVGTPGANTAPNQPSFLGTPAIGAINTPISISVVATDPQGDNVQYGFDWDNNGTYDEFTPATISGIAATVSRTFTAAGIHTIGLVARDVAGLVSTRVTHSITITAGSVVVNPGNNTAPSVPLLTSGPTQGVINTTYIFSVVSTDTEGNQIAYGFDWDNNGTYEEYTSLTASGVPATISHSWNAVGVYTYKVVARDMHGLISAPATNSITIGGGSVVVNPGNNTAPSVPVITNAPITGTVNTSYNFSVVSTDPEQNQISYGFDWDNNATYEEYTALFASGAAATIAHAWNAAGVYTFRVVARDAQGLISAPAAHTITITAAGTVTAPAGNFTLSIATGETSEGGNTVPFNVTLSAMPTGNVTLSVMSSDLTEGMTSVQSLTFTPANWNLFQTVVVTGVDDALADGSISYLVSVGPSTSSDSNFNGIAAKTIAFVNTDNEAAVVVPPASGGSSSGGSSSGGGGGGGSGRGSGAPCIGFNCPTTITTTVTNTNGNLIPGDIWILINEVASGAVNRPTGPENVCASGNLITTFMRSGIDNNASQVMKLQQFLNTYEGANLAVNGIFDASTEAAVRALQVKYTDQILAPWGVSESTGIVYITTARFINTVDCGNTSLIKDNDSDVLEPVNPTDFDGAIGIATTTIPDSSNTAGVFGAMTQRIQDFLKDIPWYQLLILLLILIGGGYIIGSAWRKDISNEELNMSLIRGAAVLAIGTVLNVLNTVSFILNPQWFEEKTGLSLAWLLALDAINLGMIILICLTVLIALYSRISKETKHN